MPTYEITCSFAGPAAGTPGEALDRLLHTVSAMREEGIDIDHEGSTIHANNGGESPTLEARLAAPTAGVVGRQLCRARLPAGGIRRVS